MRLTATICIGLVLSWLIAPLRIAEARMDPLRIVTSQIVRPI